MKKILQVCFIAAMVFGLASCSKDDNGNPQPQPGGDYPLNGTTWQTSYQEEGLYITMGVSFGTTNCLLVYSDSEGDSDQATGTYTYSGTITSGRGTITIRGDEGSFTVNGNEAAITADGETHVFTRVNQ